MRHFPVAGEIAHVIAHGIGLLLSSRAKGVWRLLDHSAIYLLIG